MNLRAVAFLAATLLACASTLAQVTVYRNANVHTMDPARPHADSFAIEGGVFVAVGAGEVEEVTRGREATIVDLRGLTVLPGLIDAHGHMRALGEFGLGLLDFSLARDFDDVVDAVRDAARGARRGAWILGGRWDHERWPARALPTHHQLSEASARNPVWLRRVDGHAGIANAAALRLAGIDRNTPNPPGGEIVRDADGAPTGVLVDNAMSLVEAVINDESFSIEAAILAAQERCLDVGLTGVHDMGVTPEEIEVYEQLARDGRLKIRVFALIVGDHAIDWFRSRGPIVGDRFSVRGTKLYMDGAMGSRGAWLKAPYADRPTDDRGRPYAGLAVTDPRVVREIALDGASRGYQVTVHAIGDRGNAEALDAFEAASTRMSPDRRETLPLFRIEHAQLLDVRDIPRFGALGVVASMQPTHCTSDMLWVEERVGAARARGAYAWASLARAGATLALGSDFPVEPENPFYGLHAAVTRQDRSNAPPGGWRPEERLTREAALRGFTVGAAFAEGAAGVKGSIARGKLADFIVIDRDVMTVEPARIPDTHVLATVIAGEVVHAAPGAPGVPGVPDPLPGAPTSPSGPSPGR